jgi:hypothetical protein
MKHIPFPTYDLQPAMKTSPERVDAIIRRMQENLQRNSNPRSFGSKNQNFRLTQGFLLSSTQQVLDKWCAQVQDTVQTVNRDCKYVLKLFTDFLYFSGQNFALQNFVNSQ